MADDGRGERLFSNRFAASTPSPGSEPDRDYCACLDLDDVGAPPGMVAFHGDRQDTASPAWAHLLELIEEAATDGRTTFKPFVELDAAERRQIVTLPASIARLTEVRHLILYGTNLVRIPPEIGAMTSLEKFDPYTSHRLHWYPYELTRCARLRDSTVSTRALYGNYKHRPPFPQLRPVTTTAETGFQALDPGTWGADAVSTCSVCAGRLGQELHQAWISLRVATDVLPLLVNACSPACLKQLPAPPSDYVKVPHTGGPGSGGRGDFVDVCHPTAAELRSWAYSAALPTDFFDVRLANPAMLSTVIDLVADPGCPHRAYLLKTLYWLIGHKDISHLSDPRIAHGVTRAEQSDALWVRVWAQRAQRVLDNPETRDFREWDELLRRPDGP